MITNTLMIFGPGGIGKSPLERLIRPDVVRIDPYRLRPDGPRDGADSFYAHKGLRDALGRTLTSIGDTRKVLNGKPSVEWFPSAKATFFDVRGEWQCLLLNGLKAKYAKAEIFAPALRILLGEKDIRDLFGKVFVVVLNPVQPLDTLSNSSSLKAKTRENCKLRGDKPGSIRKRVNSIDDELPAWQSLLTLGGTEYDNWRFPEYKYRGNFSRTLKAARNHLLARNRDLEQFFK